jgi:hypothetical protein
VTTNHQTVHLILAFATHATSMGRPLLHRERQGGVPSSAGTVKGPMRCEVQRLSTAVYLQRARRTRTLARNGYTSRRRDTKTACHEKAAERLIPLNATSICLRYVYVKYTLQTDYKILNETLALYL